MGDGIKCIGEWVLLGWDALGVVHVAASGSKEHKRNTISSLNPEYADVKLSTSLSCR